MEDKKVDTGQTPPIENTIAEIARRTEKASFSIDVFGLPIWQSLIFFLCLGLFMAFLERTLSQGAGGDIGILRVIAVLLAVILFVLMQIRRIVSRIYTLLFVKLGRDGSSQHSFDTH